MPGTQGQHDAKHEAERFIGQADGIFLANPAGLPIGPFGFWLQGVKAGAWHPLGALQFEFGRGGWRFDPLSIDFQFNLSGRAQLPPTQRNLGIVPSRNDVRP